ncbi:MAG: cytochrome P450 [Myxococcota bacterium]
MSSHRPPGPEPSTLGFLRFAAAMMKDATAAVRTRFDAHGDLYFTVSRGDPLFVTCHPDHMHEVLVTRGGDWKKRSADLRRFLGMGLLTSNGDLWRTRRRLVQPGFRHERLESYAEVMVAAADRTAEEWRQTPDRDLGRDMMACTLDVVGRTLFGYDATGDVVPIAEAMDVLQKTSGFDPIPEWVPTPAHRRAAGALERLNRVIQDLIEKRRQRPEGGDLLGHLLSVDLDDTALRDELVTLFLAGHETTALTLSWTWRILADAPEWEGRLHAEVDAVLGGRAPSLGDVERLPVTGRIVQESMRLRPPVYAIPRIAVRDTELGGFAVERGAELVMWPYWAHHDARWFPEPERFDPDRWLPDSGRVLHPRAFIPFGAGQRTCIGKSFATMEASLLLARWAQSFRLEALEAEWPPVSPQITLAMKRPLKMRAVPRASGHDT